MSQSANKLLAALPRRDYQRVRPLLRTLHLPAETGLPHCGVTRVYFPGTGLCSIINKMADGSGIEVACIGDEGVVGINALTGDAPAERNGFVQVANGAVEYMPVVFFERELARNGRFREVVDRFCHSFVGTVTRDGRPGAATSAAAAGRDSQSSADARSWRQCMHALRIVYWRTPYEQSRLHSCLDEEIAGLVKRTHTLRKYRAQLLANRAQLYRNILKRSSGRT